MQSILKSLLRDTSGATIIEYGLIVGLIALAIAFSLNTFTNQLIVAFQIIDGGLVNANSAGNSAG